MEQRLIDADALYKKLENKYKCANGGLLRFAYKDAIDDVCNAPTIDPVKHGEWIDDGTHDTCSICNLSVARYDEYDYRQYFDYCPNCGAHMDGGTP